MPAFEAPNIANVAIIDTDRTRREKLQSNFDDIPHVKATRYDNWQSFDNEVARTTEISLQLVVLHYDAAERQKNPIVMTLHNWIETLFEKAWFDQGRIIVVKRRSDVPLDLRLPAKHLKQVRVLEIDDSEFSELMLHEWVQDELKPPSLPKVMISNDIILKQQLNLLDYPQGRRELIEFRLAFVCQHYMPHCTCVEIHPLTQGYSGSLVIRAVLTADDPTGDQRHIVFKISSGAEAWKLARVVRHLPLIEKSFNEPLQHSVPILERTAIGSPVICYWGLHVEAWLYLGGDLGEFKEFGQVYCLHEETKGPDPKVVLSETVQMLERAWHSTAQEPRETVLWQNEDAPYPETPAAPPYRLTSWNKAQIVRALRDLKRWAVRFESKWTLSDEMEWADVQHDINTWISQGPEPASVAATVRRLYTSPIHGDLNHHNLLWSQKHKRPFLIDFATFQPNGHIVQDFAMLEVQIHLALMDCEESSEHPELDLSSTQFRRWMKRLPELLPSSKPLVQFTPLKSADSKLKGIVLAEDLIKSIRQEAYRIYGKSNKGPTADVDFDNEFAAALLFETLRLISYDSLSYLKRILGAHSAARLIRRLNVSAR